jgi:hypothetical protein
MKCKIITPIVCFTYTNVHLCDVYMDTHLYAYMYTYIYLFIFNVRSLALRSCLFVNLFIFYFLKSLYEARLAAHGQHDRIEAGEKRWIQFGKPTVVQYKSALKSLMKMDPNRKISHVYMVLLIFIKSINKIYMYVKLNY